MQTEIKNRLSALRRAENLRKRRKQKERARSNFFKDPFKFVKGLFTKEKVATSKQQRNASKPTCHKHTLTAVVTNRSRFHMTCHHYILQNIRYMSALPSGVKSKELYVKQEQHPPLVSMGYHTNKYTPDVLRFLWRLMRVIWLKWTIPTVWQRAGSILIPKEKHSTDISQFRQISLLNVEGKIFFNIVVQCNSQGHSQSTAAQTGYHQRSSEHREDHAP